MAKFFNIPAFLAALILIAILSVPGIAHAQSAPQDQCDGKLEQEMAKNFAQTGQNVLQAQNAAIALFAAVDVKAQTCWQNIEQAFTVLGNLSDPLALVWNLISSQVLAMVDQVCSMVLSDINQLKSFAMSQFNRICLPLPDFGMNLGGSLNLKNVTCSGVSPLTGGSPINGPIPLIYDYRTLFPQKQ